MREFKSKISESLKLENRVRRIERSDDYLAPAQIVSTRESLQKAEAANAKIDDLRKGILTVEEKDRIKAEIKEAEIGLKSLLEPLQLTPSISAAQFASMLQVQENIRQDLECVVCIEMPLPSIQIFSCQENHLLCINCKNHPDISKCPYCRQDFAMIPAQRNRLAEKMVAKLT